MRSQKLLKKFDLYTFGNLFLSNIFARFINGIRFILILAINIYRQFLSSIFDMGGNCRFHPSCSLYAKDCLNVLPLHKALFFIVIRIFKCRPFGSSGFDPAPKGVQHE